MLDAAALYLQCFILYTFLWQMFHSPSILRYLITTLATPSQYHVVALGVPLYGLQLSDIFPGCRCPLAKISIASFPFYLSHIQKQCHWIMMQICVQATFCHSWLISAFQADILGKHLPRGCFQARDYLSIVQSLGFLLSKRFVFSQVGIFSVCCLDFS